MAVELQAARSLRPSASRDYSHETPDVAVTNVRIDSLHRLAVAPSPFRRRLGHFANRVLVTI